ncbi:MAG TPA: protein kinase [Terriglobia bacterium]|nr:protein kinase [Terriglobia bacterium]
MDPDRWERVKDLFEAALALDPDARNEFVTHNSQDDEPLRLEVLALLAAHGEAGDFMEPDSEVLSRPGSATDQPPLTFCPGELIAGRFRVVRFIRRGGMGEVYEAADLELNERVALKTIRPGIASDPRTLARFKQEVQLARRVADPNVCRMYDVERHLPEDTRKPDVVFLTMELLEGETLADQLKWQGKMSCDEALPIIRQMAEGLAAAHGAGVLHCDFKPSNVMLVAEKSANAVDSTESRRGPGGGPSPEPADLRAVITDFGLARALRPAVTRSTKQKSLQAGGWEGTLPYMAPEQLEGGECNPTTDVYALGLVIYEMLTGRRPFSEATAWEEARKRLKEPPASPRVHVPELDRRWENAILRCLQIDPALRFQNTRDLLQELEPPQPVASTNTFLSAVALAMVLITVAGVQLADAPVRPSGIKSLAVLPLENVSGNADQDYFADGMTEALITDLAKISALRVVSRTSTMQDKGPQGHKKLSDAIRNSGVDAVVNGTVLRSGDQVRISAKLVDARSGNLMWAETYDRDLRDILTLQSEVARAIAEEIRIKVTSQDKARLASKRPIDTRAYEAYLRGRYAYNKGTERDWQQAREYFEKAVQIDPGFAPAYAGLADCYWSTEEQSPSVVMPEAKKNALKALQLDPNLAEAYTSLAMVAFYADWNWPEVERNFKRALEVDPSDAGAHRLYSAYLSLMGRADDALRESRKAESLNPVFFNDAPLTAGWVFYYERLYDQAIEQCSNVANQDQGSADAHDCLGEAFLATKSYQQAIPELRRAVALSHSELNLVVALARANALGGHKAEALKTLEELRARAPRTYVAPSYIAEIYIALGDKKQGLAWLNRAYADRDGYLGRLKVEPAFDAVRADPRFQDLIERLKFPP